MNSKPMTAAVVVFFALLNIMSSVNAQCSMDQTAQNEKTELCCYYDSLNIPTIGIGFNLQRGDAASILSQYAGLDLNAVLADCQDQTQDACLTNDQAYSIFSGVNYPEAQNCAESYVSGLPPTVLAAVTDVAFAGCGTLNKFVQMKAALQQQNWQGAADQLVNSVWCGQVGDRCDRDYQCIASGQIQDSQPNLKGNQVFGSCNWLMCASAVLKCADACKHGASQQCVACIGSDWGQCCSCFNAC